jgi:hypothetical protein
MQREIICATHDRKSESFYFSAKGLPTGPNEYKVLLQGFFSISASQKHDKKYDG